MNKKKAKDAIKKIAKMQGKKECEIRKEMEKAILVGFLNPKTNYKWIDIFGDGRLPSPEEFIATISGRLIK